MKLILILRSQDKQTAESPCEEIRISMEIENEAKAYKAFRSQKTPSVPFPKGFISLRSQSVSFHSEAFRFVQTVQCSRGVVARFRVCSRCSLYLTNLWHNIWLIFSLFCQFSAFLSFSSKLSSDFQAMIWQFKFDQLNDFSIMNSPTTRLKVSHLINTFMSAPPRRPWLSRYQ